jgi:hypothetical protein
MKEDVDEEQDKDNKKINVNLVDLDKFVKY